MFLGRREGVRVRVRIHYDAFGRIALIVGFGLALGLLLSEAFVRMVGVRAGYGSAVIVSDPTLHHVHQSNYEFVVYDPSGEFGGHRVRYDQEGLVVNPEGGRDGPSRAPDIRIALMGDSFVEAAQVPYEMSFAGILGRAAKEGVEIRNYGCSTYSPILYCLQWKTWVSRYRPTHVLLLLHVYDVVQDAELASIAQFNEAGDPIAVPGPGSTWWKILLRKSHLFRFGKKVCVKLAWWFKNRHRDPQPVAGDYVEENLDITERTTAYVMKLYKAVRASGGEFILAAVPSKYRLERGTRYLGTPEFSDRWKKWAKERAIPFLNLVELFWEAAEEGKSLYFQKDIHWTECGHRIVAQSVMDAYPNLFGNAQQNEKGFHTLQRASVGYNTRQ